MSSDAWGNRHKTLLAVDPGDVHVGIAEFVESDESWECVRAYELEHDAGADFIGSVLIGGQLDVLVVERFALYADKAASQIGSEMLTAQLIGIIKYLHRHYLGAQANTNGAWVETKLIFQPASIQKPTRAILRAKGVKSEARGNAHAKSAELHGWYHILKNEET